jgi:hypothetical protein
MPDSFPSGVNHGQTLTYLARLEKRRRRRQRVADLSKNKRIVSTAAKWPDVEEEPRKQQSKEEEMLQQARADESVRLSDRRVAQMWTWLVGVVEVGAGSGPKEM